MTMNHELWTQVPFNQLFTIKHNRNYLVFITYIKDK